MTEAATSNDRPIGLAGATATVIASMIGAGIFTSPGYTLHALESPTLAFAAWVIGGVIAVCGAISYGALASRLAESGGEYLYLSRAVHPWAGFVAGWTSLFAGFAGPTAVAALAMEEYLDVDAGVAITQYSPFPAIAVVILFACVQGWNTRRGSAIHVLLVIAKLAFLGLVGAALVYVFAFRPETRTNDLLVGNELQLLPGLPTSLMWIAFTYTGFNAAIYVAGEVREPEKTVPRSLLWGTATTVAIYLGLVGMLYVSVDGWLGGTNGGAAAAGPTHVPLEQFAFSQFPGTVAGPFFRTVVVTCLVTSVSALLLTGPRVLAKMADDGVMPAALTSRPGTPPRMAILVQALIAVALIATTSLRDLLANLGMTLSLCSAASVSTLLFGVLGPVSLRVRVVAVVYVAMTILFCGLAVFDNASNAVGAAAVLLSATVGYAIFRRRMPG